MAFINVDNMIQHPDYHLCHLNVGPAVAHILAPEMAGFVENLEKINQLAYDSPGFVWHLQIDIYLSLIHI